MPSYNSTFCKRLFYQTFCSLYLFTTLCIARQNLSIGVNVVSSGSPSRIRMVRRISLGITTLPKSSTRRTIPVAVPGALLADGAAASLTDRGHSLRQSTRYNVTFPASRKFHPYLGFSSPHKGLRLCGVPVLLRHRRRSHRFPVAFIVYLSPFTIHLTGGRLPPLHT